MTDKHDKLDKNTFGCDFYYYLTSIHIFSLFLDLNKMVIYFKTRPYKYSLYYLYIFLNKLWYIFQIENLKLCQKIDVIIKI